MNYYWFNREEILQKAKEIAAEYYRGNKDVLKEKVKNRYRNLTEKEKEAKKEYSKSRYKEMKKMQNYFYCIKMSEQALKFDHIVVNKKDFHASKEGIALDLVESSRKLVSDKFKHS